jgi:hypothetical protein
MSFFFRVQWEVIILKPSAFSNFFCPYNINFLQDGYKQLYRPSSLHCTCIIFYSIFILLHVWFLYLWNAWNINKFSSVVFYSVNILLHYITMCQLLPSIIHVQKGLLSVHLPENKRLIHVAKKAALITRQERSCPTVVYR